MRNWLVREGPQERFIRVRAGFGEISAPEAECRIESETLHPLPGYCDYWRSEAAARGPEPTSLERLK